MFQHSSPSVRYKLSSTWFRLITSWFHYVKTCWNLKEKWIPKSNRSWWLFKLKGRHCWRCSWKWPVKESKWTTTISRQPSKCLTASCSHSDMCKPKTTCCLSLWMTRSLHSSARWSKNWAGKILFSRSVQPKKTTQTLTKHFTISLQWPSCLRLRKALCLWLKAAENIKRRTLHCGLITVLS